MTKMAEGSFYVDHKDSDKMLHEDSSFVTSSTPHVVCEQGPLSGCSDTDSDDDEMSESCGGFGLMPRSRTYSNYDTDSNIPDSQLNDSKLHCDRASTFGDDICHIPAEPIKHGLQDEIIPSVESVPRPYAISQQPAEHFLEKTDMETEPLMTMGNLDRLNSEGEENTSVLSHHEAMDGTSLSKDMFSFSLASDFEKLTMQEPFVQATQGSSSIINNLQWTDSTDEQSSPIPRLYTKCPSPREVNSTKTRTVSQEMITIKLSPNGVKRLSDIALDHKEYPDARITSQKSIIGSIPDITPEMTSKQNCDGDTLLHVAIINRMLDMVYFVLNVVPSHLILDIVNQMKQSALHLSVLTHQHGVVRKLVVRGARIDTRDRNGDTALHLACRVGCLECAKALSTPVHHSEIGNCAYRVPFQCIPQDPNILNYDGKSCLHLSAQTANVELTRYLLSPDVGHNVNIQDARTGRTILHDLILHRNLDLLMLLIKHRNAFKLDLNVQSFDGLTANDLASDTKQSDIVFLLSLIGTKHGIG